MSGSLSIGHFPTQKSLGESPNSMRNLSYARSGASQTWHNSAAKLGFRVGVDDFACQTCLAFRYSDTQLRQYRL